MKKVRVIAVYADKLREFHEIKAKFDARIQELQKDREELSVKQVRENEAYAKALLEDVKQSNRKSQSELSQIRRGIESLEKQIADTDDRISYTKEVQGQQLKAMLPDLHKANELIIDEQRKHIKNSETEILKQKCEFLLTVARTNKYYQEAGAFKTSFLNAAHSVGNHDYDKPYLSLPLLNVAGTYLGGSALPPLLMTKEEVRNALNYGWIPGYVKFYKMEGVVLPDNEAHKRLEEMKRKEAGKNEQ